MPDALPKLITLADVRGDLHVHTKESDGKRRQEQSARYGGGAKARGYEYLAITDHTKHATVARGLDEKRLAKQLDEIERLNAELGKIRILRSSEVDILADGPRAADRALTWGAAGIRCRPRSRG
jgi:DNA polymerase (family X)